MAEQHILTITFHGICSHFHNGVIPGVPHRVVLPDATSVHAATTKCGWMPGQPVEMFLLMPHVAAMAMLDPAEPASFFELDGYISDKGYIFTSSRLTVVNSLDTSVSYNENFAALPHLTTFVDDFSPATDVILGGRASAYFDIQGGDLSVQQTGGALHGVATMLTDGPPRVRIEPLGPMPSLQPHVFTLPETAAGEVYTSSLMFGNVDLVPEDASHDDWMWHLQINAAGIPDILPKALPGMSNTQSMPIEQATELLRSKYLLNAVPAIIVGSDPSCSNSQYP